MSSTTQESINLDNITFKPAVTKEVTYLKGKLLAEAGITGEVLIGTYKSSSENDYGKSYAFTLAKPLALEGIEAAAADQIVIINGCSTLDRQMDEVRPGSLVQVVYDGMKEGKKGKTYHAFTVNIAQ